MPEKLNAYFSMLLESLGKTFFQWVMQEAKLQGRNLLWYSTPQQHSNFFP